MISTGVSNICQRFPDLNFGQLKNVTDDTEKLMMKMKV